MAIEKIAVIGCGRMGLGLAECAASAGVEVVAVKLTPGDLERPTKTLAKAIERRVKKGKITEAERDAILGRVKITRDLADLADAQLVVESCVEELKDKGEVLSRVEAAMNDDAILATNTSSLRLTELARFVRRPSRFLGLHFFNPVAAMKLVELAPIADTDPDATQAAKQFCQAIGKEPVQIQDSPGYVVNRLLVPYILHAIETLEAGVADAESIDTSMKLGCGHPMGPLSLADLIGLDVVFAMAKTLHTELRDTRYRAPSMLRRLVLAGHLGRKSGRGIYDYTGETPSVNPAIRVEPTSIATGT